MRDESARPTRVRLPYSVLLEALACIARGQRVQAWREARRAIAAAPRDGLVLVLASRLLHLLGDYRAALDAARAAMELGVESAAMLRYDQARAVGWYHEARAVLERLLTARRGVSGSGPSADAARDKAFDRALGHLLGLYLDAHHYEGAGAVLDAFLPLTRGSAAIHLRAARVHERRGDTERALAAIQGALAAEPPTSSVLLEAAPLLVQIGAFAEARAMYEALLAHDAAAPTALEALAQLCLWRGDCDGALAYAERLSARDPASTAARRIGAAVRVLAGDCAGALPLLDTVLHDNPNDGEAYVWRAEARLRLGRNDEALADAQRSPPGAGHSFAARALHVLAASGGHDAGCAGTGSAGAAPRFAALRSGRWLRRSDAPSAGVDARNPAGIAAHARHEFAAELAAIDADAPKILATNASDAVADLLERALVAMRGNRTPLATWVREDGTLARLPPSTSARVASRQALELIKIASPEETLRRFDAVIARLPDSSMPLVHRGELHLWLGRYAEARADLEAAIAIHRQTRWAWYGLASIDLVAGDPERALATCAFGIQVMDNTEGPVAFLYRGEAYRLLGRLDEARLQLERACELHPRRLSAWINLALVHGAQGDHAAQRNIFSRLTAGAPGLLSEAAFELGEDVFRTVVLEGRGLASRPDASPGGETIDRVLKQALAMMRGNRSSSCITFFTRDGQLRHVPQGQRIDPGAEDRVIAQLRQVLTKAIESR